MMECNGYEEFHTESGTLVFWNKEVSNPNTCEFFISSFQTEKTPISDKIYSGTNFREIQIAGVDTQFPNVCNVLGSNIFHCMIPHMPIPHVHYTIGFQIDIGFPPSPRTSAIHDRIKYHP